MNLDPYRTSFLKTNFRWIIDLNVKGKIVKASRREYENNFLTLSREHTQLAIKEKIDELDFINYGNLTSSEGQN